MEINNFDQISVAYSPQDGAIITVIDDMKQAYIYDFAAKAWLPLGKRIINNEEDDAEDGE